MPKLGDKTLARNRERIEAAAQKRFVKQGFHGTTIREIADDAGISIGAIYTYFPTKEELFSSLVRRYAEQISAVQANQLKPLLGRTDSDSLRELAKVVRDIVYSHPDYWRLMYVDVVEFGNRHFASSFRKLSVNLSRLAGGFDSNGKGLRHGVDASAAYTAIYLQFFTYFLVEKLFGGRQHLGQTDDGAIEQMIRIFREGVCENAIPVSN